MHPVDRICMPIDPVVNWRYQWHKESIWFDPVDFDSIRANIVGTGRIH